jgi:hypothetical protein
MTLVLLCSNAFLRPESIEPCSMSLPFCRLAAPASLSTMRSAAN